MSISTHTPSLITRQAARAAGKKRYRTGRACGNGHVDERLVSNGRCASCLKEWKKQNRENVNSAQQKHRKAHPERWRVLGRTHYWRNVEKKREQARTRARAKAAKRTKRRILYADPIQRGLANRMRCRMWSALKRGKGRKLEAVLGYSIAELKRHLERQFTQGMSWDNWSDWHIDHIVPVTAFQFTNYDDPEFRACWALTNLRPLWKEENRQKSYFRTHLL